MKVRYNSHASISITTDSKTKIVTDPWFYNPIYGGMMWCFPQSKLRLSDYIDHDIIVISHIHPDHYCQKSLKCFDKERVLILIPDLPTTKPIREFLKDEKFKFQLIKNNESYKITDNEEIYFYHSENTIDSAQIIKCNNTAIFNMNDCFLEEKKLKEIGKDFNIKHSFIFFMGVGPFPGSFKNYDNEKKYEILQDKKRTAFSRAKKSLQLLGSKNFTAYSNDMTWPRRADLIELNGCLKQEFYTYIESEKIGSISIPLESNGTLDLDTMNVENISQIFSTREEMAKAAKEFSEQLEIKNQIAEYVLIENQYNFNHTNFLIDMKRASKELKLLIKSEKEYLYSSQRFIIRLHGENDDNTFHSEIVVELEGSEFFINDKYNEELEDQFTEDDIILELSSNLIGACQAGFYTTEDLTNCRIKITRYKEFSKEEELFWRFWSMIYNKIAIEKPQYLGLVGRL